VPKDLLHDADVDALLDQRRPCGVPGVVDPYVSYSGLLEDDLPLAPVLRALDRSASPRGEDEVVVVPELAALLRARFPDGWAAAEGMTQPGVRSTRP
jgi:hypothetical protein